MPSRTSRRADHPVQLARLAERAGEEDPHHVHEHRGDEQHRRPVVHLPHQQAAAHVEGDVQRRGVGVGHRHAAQLGVGALVRRLRHARVRTRTSGTPRSAAARRSDHSAISPSMNDQWSGNTLRRFFRISVARPSRSSAQPATAPALLGFLAVAASARLVSAILLVSTDMVSHAPRNSARRARRSRAGPPGSPRRPPSCASWGSGRAAGPNSTLPGVGQVEGRLVAGAEQVVGRPLVQRDRAADVGADLGVADDALDRPVQGLPPTRSRSGTIRCRITAALALATSSSVPSTSGWPSDVGGEQHLGLGVDQVADLEVGRP